MTRYLLPTVSVLVGAAILLPAPALAWKHIDPNPYAWHPDDLPVQYYVAPEHECEESVPSDYCATVLQEAHEAWDIGAPCANLGGGEYLGPVPPEICPSENLLDEDGDGMCTNLGFEIFDGKNTVGFNDPNNELEVGVLGANLTNRFQAAFLLNGKQYKWVDNSDIVFNNDVDFATHEEVAGGQCGGRTNLRSVATHEVGHLYGMGHSCDEFDPCTDPDLASAVMFWTSPNCETLIDIQKDDLEGINTLYGPSASFACSHQVSEDLAIGVVPFEMKCVVESADYLQEVVSASWQFGDGNVADGINVTNTYDEPGNYTIEVNVTGQRDGCVSGENPDGSWESNFRRVGFVRACGLPEVAFTYEHVDGLTYQMMNESDVSVFGCIQDIEWQVFEGEGTGGQPIAELSKKAWEPLITFPEDGTYTVLVNVGGPAGTSAAMLTLEARNRSGQGRGCSNAGVAGLGSMGLMAVAVGLLGLRRRRD